jgi:hypothetical protein
MYLIPLFLRLRLMKHNGVFCFSIIRYNCKLETVEDISPKSLAVMLEI